MYKSEKVQAFITLQSLELKIDDYSTNCEPTQKPLTKKNSSLTSTSLLLSQTAITDPSVMSEL